MIERFPFVLSLLLAAAGPAAAQTTTAIEGIVFDPSGAAVPGASLRLTETATRAFSI